MDQATPGHFALDVGNPLMVFLAAILLDQGIENTVHIPGSRLRFITDFKDRLRFQIGQHPITKDVELTITYVQTPPDILVARN